MIINMLKISFSGAPGCGRSSLSQEVCKILSLRYRVSLIDEISWKNPFDDAQKSSFESQFFFLTTQINEENRLAFSLVDYIVCDQSVLDQWVSWLSFYERQNEKTQKKLAEHHQLMQSLFKFWVHSYSMHFFIRVSHDVWTKRQAEIKLRQVNGLDQPEREKRFIKTIQEENIPVIEIWNNTTVDETALNIIQHIQDYQSRTKSDAPGDRPVL